MEAACGERLDEAVQPWVAVLIEDGKHLRLELRSTRHPARSGLPVLWKPVLEESQTPGE